MMGVESQRKSELITTTPYSPPPSPGKLQALEGNGTGETNWSQVDTIYPSNHGSHWNSDTVIPHDWAGRSGGDCTAAHSQSARQAPQAR